MKKLIEAIPNHLKDALFIGKKATLNWRDSHKNIQNVVISGLGGSGIGGTVVSQILENECKIPVVINKNYTLPTFVDEHTLVIVSSFSGNTEETLKAFEYALEKGAEIVCITSGGELRELSRKHQLNYVKLPPCDSPRAMMFYSVVQQMTVLVHYGVVSSKFVNQVENAIILIEKEIENIKKIAHSIAEKIDEKPVHIYVESYYESVAVRWRQQINENSKKLCSHHVIPEMNHNELVAWEKDGHNHAVILLRNEDELPKNKFRFDITKPFFEEKTSNITEVWSKGKTKLERSIYLLVVGDWVSLYLAKKRGVDPANIECIHKMKKQLASY